MRVSTDREPRGSSPPRSEWLLIEGGRAGWKSTDIATGTQSRVEPSLSDSARHLSMCRWRRQESNSHFCVQLSAWTLRLRPEVAQHQLSDPPFSPSFCLHVTHGNCTWRTLCSCFVSFPPTSSFPSSFFSVQLPGLQAAPPFRRSMDGGRDRLQPEYSVVISARPVQIWVILPRHPVCGNTNLWTRRRGHSPPRSPRSAGKQPSKCAADRCSLGPPFHPLVAAHHISR